MIRRALIPLSLCCVVLCVLVGFLSHRAIQDTERVASKVEEIACDGFIKKQPRQSTGVIIQDFKFYDRVATWDFDGDGQWDEVAVPLFSTQPRTSKAYYKSVIAWFKGIPDQAALDQALAVDQLRADFWISKQHLPENLKSGLAEKYRKMDFKKSPVILVGFEQSNPVLGETSLSLSYTIGIGAVAVCALSLIVSLLLGVGKKLVNMLPKKPEPTVNRAGLPAGRNANAAVESTGGVLDRVRSMRDSDPNARPT